MDHSALATLACLATVILIHYIRTYRRGGRYSHLPLPPGPKRLPLLGNIFNMPSPPEWETYHQWAEQYDTDIIYLNVAGRDMIVLDTFKAAFELLERRSAIYSSRPHLHVARDLLGFGSVMGLLGYGDQWRRQRRLVHQSFHPAGVDLFRPYLLQACRNLLHRFLVHPGDDVMENIRHMTAESILQVTYGIQIKEENDPYVKVAEHGEEGFLESAVPGAFWVESFPILSYVQEWMPGAGFKRKIREWRESVTKMREETYAAAKEMWASGVAKHSFVSYSLDRMTEGDAEQEKAIKDAALGMYGAGTDTTLATIASCILALLEHPDVLKKAQEELDSVIRPGHLPDFEDEKSLPYVTAITMEALRWRYVTPTGIPHQVTVEDEYKGYRIPAGSVVMANSWAMLHNDKVYENPFSFSPDRFTKNGELNKEAWDPAHACWGFGRRICSGRYMAFSSIWVTLASMMYSFDIQKAKNTDGSIIEPTHEYTANLIYMPKPFKCSITPRSKEVERVIRESYLISRES